MLYSVHLKFKNVSFLTCSYNSVVRFECPKAKGFTLAESNETTVFIDFRCQWNQTWDPDPNQLPICKREILRFILTL